MKAETTPAIPGATDERALADRAKLHRMADEILWLVFAERRAETLQ